MTLIVPSPYAARLTKLRTAMAAKGADLALIDHGELIGWLTGYSGSETMYRAVLVPMRGVPWIVLRKLDAPQVEAQGWMGAAWRDHVIGFNDWDDPFAEVAHSIVARGFRLARILIDNASYSFTAHAQSRLTQALEQTTFSYCSGLSDQLRAVKDEVEIELLRRAAGIADRSMERLRGETGVGSTTRQAGAIVASSYMGYGADDGQVGRICKGQSDTGFLHAVLNDEPLREGDVLHVELVPRVSHYSARLMRPIAIGSANPETTRLVETLIAHQDRQIAAMASGAIAGEVDAIIREGLLGDGLRQTYENVSGYLLGLYGRTPRSSDFSLAFLPGSRWVLEAGMVFHMYTSAAGIGVSETVLVTDQGGERLTRTPRRLLVSGQRG